MNSKLYNLKQNLEHAGYSKNGPQAEALICQIVDILEEQEREIEDLKGTCEKLRSGVNRVKRNQS